MKFKIQMSYDNGEHHQNLPQAKQRVYGEFNEGFGTLLFKSAQKVFWHADLTVVRSVRVSLHSI